MAQKKTFIGILARGLLTRMSRGRLPLIEAICNCEKRYCTYSRNRDLSGVIEYCLKGHYIARINPEKCTACGRCLNACEFGAISHSKIADTVDIDVTKCYGCGLCRSRCKHDAISMVSREMIPAARNLW